MAAPSALAEFVYVRKMPISGGVIQRARTLAIADIEDFRKVLFVDRISGDYIGARHAGEIFGALE
jgi:hypothetical protein